MRVVKNSELQKAMNSAQKTRLHRFRKDLRSDRTKVIFDDRLVDCVRPYLYSESEFNKTLEYLNDVTDPLGFVYSRSLKRWDELKLALLKFEEKDYSPFTWNKNYQKSLEQLKQIFSKWKLKSLSYNSDDDIRQALPKVNTHSGYTYLITGKKCKGDNMERILSKYLREEAQARSQGSFNKPILPATRTQGSGAFDEFGEFTNTCKHKTRLVSMVDLMQIIGELKFAKPLQNKFASFEWYAGGYNLDQIRSIINARRADYQYWMSLDYSNFDASVSSWLIKDAFSCLRVAFVSLDEDLWNIIIDDFIHKNFIVPMDLQNGIIHSDRGVPSGSMFTQIIDTVVNWIIILTYLNAKKIDGKMIVMGDDNLLFSKTAIDREDVATYISKNFGMVVSSTKTLLGRSSQSPVFLSMRWDYDGTWRHPNELIARMAYPERFRPYDKEDVEPSEVLLGYILTYPNGMNEMMNIIKFFNDHPNLSSNMKTLGRVDSRYIPGAITFNKEYLLSSA